MLALQFDTRIIEWRGPAPYFYAPVPVAHADDIRRVSKVASYGWGVIPVDVTIAGVNFTTSLFPRDGTYLLPLKVVVRKATGITAGDTVQVEMTVRPRR